MSKQEKEVWECKLYPFHKELKKELAEFRKRRGFDVKKWIDEKCTMFNNYMKKCGLKACCVNCSGGIDSASTIALCHYASKMKDSPIKKIVGIAQPIKSTASIQNRAYELKKFAEMITVDQSDIFDLLSKKVEKSVKIEGIKKEKLSFAQGMLKSYMRTPVAYYVAQLISQQGLGCVVMGTGNFDEDGYLYYFCKAGDGIADIQLINDLHKSEVFAVAKALDCPESILKAAPSADLWEGQTDEGELGFSYDFVELYTEWLNSPKDYRDKMLARLSKEALAQFKEYEKKIVSVHRRNSHKETYPINLNLRKFTLKKELVDIDSLQKKEEKK